MCTYEGVSCLAKTTKLRRSAGETPAPRNVSPPRNWLFAVAFTFSAGSPATGLITQLRLNMLDAAIFALIEHTNKVVLAQL